MFLWLNHGTQMSESPWVNVAFHVGVNRNLNNTGFTRGANIVLMALIRFKKKTIQKSSFYNVYKQIINIEMPGV